MDIILFGAGKNLLDYWNVFFNPKYNIVAVVDNSKESKQLPNGMFVSPVSKVTEIKFDAVIITIVNQKIIWEIYRQLQDMEVNSDRIWYFSNGRIVHSPRLLKMQRVEGEDPYVFFELTDLTQRDYGTGIQRTVKRLYDNLKEDCQKILAIRYFSRFITSREYEYRYGVQQGEYDEKEYLVEFQEGDIVFFPDTSWTLQLDESIFETIHHNGAKISFMVYDLTPIRKKEFLSEKSYQLFTEWMQNLLKYADSVVCISETVANDLALYYKELNYKREESLPLYVNYLGYDIPQIESVARKEITEFVCQGDTFLMVGSVQPLKNHLTAVDALKKVYEKYLDMQVQILMLGRPTDYLFDFQKLITSDELLRSKVLWIKDAGDEELIWAYKNCTALLFPSQAEGFGLPLVEASCFNLPILCSDIPIFREIAGENATYFKVNDSESLSQTIVEWLQTDEPIMPGGIQKHSWKESAENIAQIFSGKIKPYKVLS